MSRELNFSFPLVNGLHARPASIFRDAASRFTSTMTLANRENNATANAKSTLALVAMLTKKGDSCTLLIDGEDEQTAFEAMNTFIESDLPICDDELMNVPGNELAVFLPRILKTEGTLIHKGIAVSKGIVSSRAYVANSGIELPDVSQCPKGTVAEEISKIEQAFQKVVEHVRSQLALSDNKTQQEIVKAHLSIAEDTEFRERALSLVRDRQSSAGTAVVATTEHFTRLLQQSGSVYLRERILDIKDIARLIIHELYGFENADQEDTLKNDGIWISENLSPSQFIALNKEFLKGIVLSQGGTTSHTVILARAFGIPCVTGAKDIQLKLQTGREVIVDGERGIVVPDPSPSVLEFYRNEMKKLEMHRNQLMRFKDIPGATADGRKLEIGANVGSYEEATAAFRNGAEGIGLFRTELLFMNRTSPPGEEDQFKVYADTARLAGKRSVIIRTLDIGGDKPASYLNLPPEANPFLGFRAVRMYEAHKGIIETQLRAILRASAFGNLKIMIPMVSTVAEVRTMRQWTSRIMDDLGREGIQFNRNIEIGIMVEIPSVAFTIDQLSRDVDFFSIGSNDLTQYFLAVDRDNDKVSHLFSSFHPSFLRFMKKIIDDAHAQKKWVGLCGELGANRLALPLFVGYGIDEISLASPDIALMKSTLSECRSVDCNRLLESALQKETPLEVETMLKEFLGRATDHSLIIRDLVRIDSESRSKEEVLRELVNILHLAGRVEDADRVEEAIWQREDAYSTGVGFQVAIPHCKSPNVLANSIAVVKLKTAIEWNSLDKQPVDLVILIVINGDKAGEEHLKMIASLSKKLMDEDFRERMMSAKEETALLELVKSALKS